MIPTQSSCLHELYPGNPMTGLYNPSRDNITPNTFTDPNNPIMAQYLSYQNYNRMASGLQRNYFQTLDYYKKHNDCSRAKAQPKTLDHQTNDPDDAINDPRLNPILSQSSVPMYDYSMTYPKYEHINDGVVLPPPVSSNMICGQSGPASVYLPIPLSNYESFDYLDDSSKHKKLIFWLIVIIVIMVFVYIYKK